MWPANKKLWPPLYQTILILLFSLGCKYDIDFGNLNEWLRMIYTICGAISLFFLALTLFFYATLPDLSTFHGKIGRKVISHLRCAVQAFLLYPIFVPYLMVLLSLCPVSRHILFQLICLTSAIDPAGYFQESKEVCVSRPGQVFSIFFNGYHKALSCDLICSILQIKQLE